MQPLYQRLKELDSNTFEKLVFHLLKDRHPGADIHRVEGSGGDQGIDIFCGDLDSGPVVWQVKSFASGVGKSQKEKIRQSLREVLKHHRPRQWVLCLSVDLDTKTHLWFQRLAKSYTGHVEIGLFSAGQIVQELIHRRAVREIFFPQAVLDLLEIREVFSKTGGLTTEELATITVENVDQYLDRLKGQDARFTYQVLFCGNGKPTDSVAQPGLLASVFDGTKTIQVFARDVEALRANPMRATVSLNEAGVNKFNEFIRTGRAQELL